MVTIELNPAVSKEEWQAYVESHPQGLMSHLPQWQEVLVESFHHKPFYLFARDEGGRLCGLLPLFQIRSMLTGNRLVSLPISQICGPIADSEGILNELVRKASDLCHDLGCHYLELRMAEPRSFGLPSSDYFSTYVLDLSEAQAVWRKLDQKSVRWAINKARKDGLVVVRVSSTDEDLKYFYQLNQKTKRRLGVPGHPLAFLKNMCSKMDKFTKLYLAEFEGRAIAGIITLSFKDTVNYAYAASDDRYLKYHPNNLLVWQAIEESCNQGYHYFDFGKTSQDNEGLARFKKHWGTEPKKLYYYYYPHLPRLMSANREGVKYRLITSLWRRTPLFLTRVLSPIAFRHLD
ncbi:GNAT family N-acetyltransferase [Candidatus Bathyarchaeota archaeon]|nr:GNAT family N-acetyltransferase [Candidatus Bathyarchaeota archaeon]